MACGLPDAERLFFMLPLGHSDDLALQERSIRYLEEEAVEAPPRLCRWGAEHTLYQAGGHRDAAGATRTVTGCWGSLLHSRRARSPEIEQRTVVVQGFGRSDNPGLKREKTRYGDKGPDNPTIVAWYAGGSARVLGP